MDDIIGTPVERAIPEGWHALLEEETRHDDLAEWGQSWDRIGCNCIGLHTDARGYMLFEGRFHLVIRRNAPVVEPSVESLKAERDMWEKACHVNERSVTRLTRERDEWKAHFAASEAQVGKLEAKVAELEAEVEKWKGTWTLSRNKHQGALDAKDAEIEKLRRFLDEANKERNASAAKLWAVKKAWEGA